jgi:hypothetical protein
MRGQLLCALSAAALVACAAGGRAHRLAVEPAPPLPVPAGAEPLRWRGTTLNERPIGADEAEFSPEVCERLSLLLVGQGLGQALSQLESNAVLVGSHFDQADRHADACIFGPPPTLVAALTITTREGALHLSIRVSRTADSPPPPDSEAEGSGSVLGGTGRSAGASGEFNLRAKSHGALLPGTNVATHRDVDINGYIMLRGS